MDIDLGKYENVVYDNLDEENIHKIISFLEEKNCSFIDQLLEEYLDIFTFQYDEFILKYNILNKKYNDNLIDAIIDNMNIIEEFYTV